MGVDRSRAARCIVYRGKTDSRLCDATVAAVMDLVASSWFAYRPACASDRLGRLLCSQRPASPAFDAADDGYSRTGCGSEAHRCGLAQTCGGNSRRGASSWYCGVL